MKVASALHSQCKVAFLLSRAGDLVGAERHTESQSNSWGKTPKPADPIEQSQSATVTSRREKSGHEEAFMRRTHYVACATLVLAVFSSTVAGATSSPYPATLTMQRGLSQSSTNPALPWGTTLTAAQARQVTLKSSGPTFRWGVWKKNGGPETFPVRSTDGGAHWTAAGPQLATDWAGGSLFYVSKVIPESSTSVVMVSNSIIDVTTDRGHQWYQYLNTADNWSITGHAVSGGIGLRIGPASYALLPKASYALYVLDIAHHQWHRTAQSLG
jgi:hypothetical protein